MSETRPQSRRAEEKRVGAVARWLLPSLGSFCLLLVLYLLVTNSWRFLMDGDTGWHIRTGELIVANAAVPRQDPFSHTLSGGEWFAWEWLSDVVMALLESRFGLAGVVGGAILVLWAGYAWLNLLMTRRGADPVIAFALTIFTALCCIVHWLARPHLLSIVLMIAWCAMVESYRRRRARWIFLAPLLIALWANLHGAFVSAFVVLGIYFVGEWLEFGARGEWWSGQWRRVLKTYLIVGALSAAAALLTPYGFKLYGHLWRYLTDRELLATINEFQSPNFHSTDGKLIEILLLLGVVAAVNALRRRRFVESGLVLLWGHLTLQSERHVTLAAVTLGPIIAEQISALISEIVEVYAQGSGPRARAVRAARGWYRETIRIDRQLSGSLVYAASLLFVLWLPLSPLADKLLAPRFSPARFPVAAADFVLRNTPPGQLYADDQFGGYLIYRLYPQYRVFVDGRSDFYRQGTVLEDLDKIVQVKPQWSGLLDRYHVRWMVLRRDEPLASIALMSGQWAIVHEDQVAQVLVRKDLPRNQAVINRLKTAW